MTINLRLSSEQEERLRAGAARRDARAVREILIQAVDSTVEGLLQTSAPQPQATTLSTLLDGIAMRLRCQMTRSRVPGSTSIIREDLGLPG